MPPGISISAAYIRHYMVILPLTVGASVTRATVLRTHNLGSRAKMGIEQAP